jgi:hypothetical protein
VDPNDLVARHCEHPERVVCTQVLFCREREVSQVVERLQVFWMNPGDLTLTAVSGYVFVSVMERPFEPFQLQRAQLILAGALNIL